VTQSLEILGGGHDPVGVSSQPIKFSSTASDRTCAGSNVPLEFISSKKDTRALEKNIVNIFFQRAEHGLKQMESDSTVRSKSNDDDNELLDPAEVCSRSRACLEK
jgi:hypothetical protein